jgi:hypothetical protein
MLSDSMLIGLALPTKISTRSVIKIEREQSVLFLGKRDYKEAGYRSESRSCLSSTGTDVQIQ